MKPATEKFLSDNRQKWGPAPGPLSTECFVWHGSRVNGYPQIWNPQKQRPYGGHRYVCELEHGEASGFVASHLCHNPACINPAHLQWETQRQNTDRRRLGLKGPGYRKKGDKYEARSYENGKQIYLGLHDTEILAHEAVLAHWNKENKRKGRKSYMS